MNVEIALRIAVAAHAGQLDKAGAPYILHPLAIMNKVEAEDEKIVALLHDVVEDTEITLKDLEASEFAPHIIAAIDAITKKEGERYDDYLVRVAHNFLAYTIKKIDIKENSYDSRYINPTSEDFKRCISYRTKARKLEAIVNLLETGFEF